MGGNLLGSSNEAKVLAEWNEKQSEQFIECFNKYNQRFGWGDPMNSFYIQRSVIYTGDKDRVLAKYDDFVQNSLLAKSDRQDIVVTVPMPDFIHDHYVDYLMTQIGSTLDQLSYPDIIYKTEKITLRKNSEDGMRYWLLIGALNCKLCINKNGKYYARFLFKIAVYSKAMDINSPNINDINDGYHETAGNRRNVQNEANQANEPK